MIRVQIDTRALTTHLTDVERRQLPYAISQGLTTLAFRVRDAERRALDRNFTIAPAVKTFVASQINVTEKATKAKPSAVVAVAGKRKQILDRHETGGTFTARGLSSQFFVPADYLRPTNISLPARNLYPANLRLAPRRTPDGVLAPRVLQSRGRGKRGQLLKQRSGALIADRSGNPILFGKRNTFLIPPRNGNHGGIYQRTGPHRTDVQRLWLLVNTITLPARLHFEDTWRVVVLDWDAVFAEKLAFAVRTAR